MLLMILKIIGVVLLCVIAIILLTLLAVLFVPVRYRIDALWKDKKFVKLKVTWLLHLISIQYNYPEPAYIVVRILGIRVYSSKEKDEEPKTKQDTVQEKEQNTEQNTEQNIDQNTEQNIVQETKHVDTAPAKDPDLTKETHQENKLKNLIDRIQYTFRSICDKIKKIWENIDYYLSLFQDERTQAFIKMCLLRGKRLYFHIIPRKIKADLIFGTGEPDTTGYLYALYGMLSPRLGKNVIVTPDFEEKRLEGEIHAKGLVQAYVLLWNGLKIYFDKDLKKLIQKLKREA